MQDKTAGVTVYLLEELTDARLRCDQLKRYVDQAVKLVNQSTNKDHVHEVAGNLLYGIPDALMRLDKALDATALAASRLDYEELKQGLRPEKVQELEEVMKDVRIRHFDRRAPALEGLAMRKLATGSDVVSALRKLASAIEREEQSGVAPSRSKIVRTLQHMASSIGLVPGVKMAAPQQQRARFEEGKPADPTENMSPEDAKKWKEMTEEHKDEFKSASGLSTNKMLSKVVLDNAKGLLAASTKGELYDGLWDVLDQVPLMFRRLWVPELVVAQRRVNTYLDGVRASMVDRDEPVKSSVRALVRDLFLSAKGMVKESTLEGYQRSLLAILNLTAAIFKRMGETEGVVTQNRVVSLLEDALAENEPVEPVLDLEDRQASEQQRARFEEGKPADPTENMSPEDAKKWKEMTEEHKDEFKSASSAYDRAVQDKSLLPKPLSARYVKELKSRLRSDVSVVKSETTLPRGWDYGNYTVLALTLPESKQQVNVAITMNVAEGEVSGNAALDGGGVIPIRVTSPERFITTLTGELAHHYGSL